jgi:hypothetical protein
MVYSSEQNLFILEHYFASKSYAALHEAFTIAYPNKEVQKKTKALMSLIRFNIMCNDPTDAEVLVSIPGASRFSERQWV